MAYFPLSRFLLRAPLLPISALKDPRGALLAHPLGRDAIALASPSLAEAAAGPKSQRTERSERAINRYGRRAAYRPTPHGLLAGVAMGTLGATSRIATGEPRPVLDISWERAAAFGRALLDRAEVRPDVRLRATPSLLRSGQTIRWLAPAEPFVAPREAELDARLARILDAAVAWTPWAALRRAAAEDTSDDAPADATAEDDAADELLLLLIDDGLLLDDLTPPLIGPSPLAWLTARLPKIAAAESPAHGLRSVAAALAAGDATRASVDLLGLPGAERTLAGIHGILVFDPPRPATLARTAVQRAAALAPLLFRLQEALSPPAAERLSQPAVGEALTAVTEIFGAGALDLGALALGDYGIDLEDEHDQGEAAVTAHPPAALLTLLIDRITATLVAGGDQASFSAAEIAAALDDVAPSPPPTAELFLTPCRSPRGAAPGTDWLLGLHAPAGASWGRFTAALGRPLRDATLGLGKAEQTHFPAIERLDVAFAPSAALADLCRHPPARRRALALTGWPDGTEPSITLADLELCADPAAVDPLALRTRDARQSVAPSPLSRVRSTTAPGWYQLLAGWSLYRQHAPWALALGPLGNLARLPRIAIDGFVVAPASWRLPHAIDDRGAVAISSRALARWRRDAAVPRVVQVGHEDQLIPVDLDAAAVDVRADLAGAERVWELWPPPERGLDRDGRRLEAVIAVVDRPDRGERAQHDAAASATAELGAVLPPHTAPAAAGWRTFKLFGVEARQDALLVGTIAPVIGDALAAAEIDAWFFIRYIDGPGRRPHLRLRIHAATATGEAAFGRRLEQGLVPARADASVVTVETSEYHPEYARFHGAENLLSTLRIFQLDSQLACALLETAPHQTAGGVELLVRSMECLATGLGFSLAERHALARQRRDASCADGALPERKRADDAEFRACARRLRQALAGPANDVATRLLADHRERVAAAATSLAIPTRQALLPTFLHLGAVRLCGLDSDRERRAYVLWERTLEGLLARRS